MPYLHCPQSKVKDVNVLPVLAGKEAAAAIVARQGKLAQRRNSTHLQPNLLKLVATGEPGSSMGRHALEFPAYTRSR